jgi:hypothetical protein
MGSTKMFYHPFLPEIAILAQSTHVTSNIEAVLLSLVSIPVELPFEWFARHCTTLDVAKKSIPLILRVPSGADR